MNNVHSISSTRGAVATIDAITAKAQQLHSLLATLAIAIEAGDLPSLHAQATIWLASDLSMSLYEAASLMVGAPQF